MRQGRVVFRKADLDLTDVLAKTLENWLMQQRGKKMSSEDAAISFRWKLLRDVLCNSGVMGASKYFELDIQIDGSFAIEFKVLQENRDQPVLWRISVVGMHAGAIRKDGKVMRRWIT